MADLSSDLPLPVPETDDLGRYLEDTITIDWQTPSVLDCARRLLAEAAAAPEGPFAAGTAESRIARLFRFVRDEIVHSFDRDPSAASPTVPSTAGLPAEFFRRDIACRASEVLALGHGLCFAKSHLLAALLRFAGHPTGFCYGRLVDDEKPGRFVLHGFVAVHWPGREGWVLLDPRGDRAAEPATASECRFAPPFSLAYAPDPARGESLLPFVYKRPGKRIVDWLERVPDEKTLRRSVPDALR